MEIARQMGEPIAQKQKDKNDPATVRQWVKRGTRLMENVLGEERWRAQVEAMKAEAERWNDLTEEEQEAEEFLERYAEARGISLEVARELVAQEYYPPDLSSLQTIRLENAIEARRRLAESRAQYNDQHGSTEA